MNWDSSGLKYSRWPNPTKVILTVGYNLIEINWRRTHGSKKIYVCVYICINRDVHELQGEARWLSWCLWETAPWRPGLTSTPLHYTTPSSVILCHHLSTDKQQTEATLDVGILPSPCR